MIHQNLTEDHRVESTRTAGTLRLDRGANTRVAGPLPSSTIRYERHSGLHLAFTTLACALICRAQAKRLCP